MSDQKKYYIEIYYRTGDSYNTDDETSEVGLSWDNLEIAKANLKRIREHHQWYEAEYGYVYESPGYVKPERPSFTDDKRGHCLSLITDDGNEMMMSAFWCGHFESLHCAQIKEREDPDMVYNARGY